MGWLGWAVVVLLGGWTEGLCPPRCVCRDDALSASCADVGLEVVPIQLNPDVQRIDLPGNRINAVHYTLSFYTGLRYLDVSRNRIGSLGGKNFEAQSLLVYLNASHNQVVALGKDAFRGLKSVKILDISYNQIETLEEGSFRDAADLEHLDISNNRITYFAEPSILKNVKALKTLYLNGNQIVDVPTGLLKNLPTPCSLDTLKLSDNLIETIEDKSFPSPCSNSLRVLTLGSNVIRDIERSAFNPLHSLSVLDLSYNNLSSVPTQQLSKLSRLTELDLSGNTLTEVRPVAFQSLFQLKVLKLCGMPRMNRVDSRAFVDNIRLESVALEKNPKLRKMPARVFHGNPHLVSVSLRGNSLTTVDVSHFPLDRLRVLDVSENPLHCNCSLLWLWTLARESDRSTPAPFNDTEEGGHSLRIRANRMLCASPEHLKGLNIVDLQESSVRCETTWVTVAVVTALVLALFGATCVALLLFGGTDKFCRSKRDDEVSAVDPRRMPPGMHAAPPPILMLMPPDKRYSPDPLVQGYVKANGDLWLSGQNEYTPDLTTRKPHIVYV